MNKIVKLVLFILVVVIGILCISVDFFQGQIFFNILGFLSFCSASIIYLKFIASTEDQDKTFLDSFMTARSIGVGIVLFILGIVSLVSAFVS